MPCARPPDVRHDRGMTTPALLAISHGTASAEGQATIRRLVDAVAERLPEAVVRLGHVDVQQPDVASSLDALAEGKPVIIVPSCSRPGITCESTCDSSPPGARASRSRTRSVPTRRLVDILVDRLGPLGDADALVLAVAGSSDERANDDCRAIGAMLGERLQREVTVGFLAAADPRLGAAVTQAASSGGRVVVANYLLAPGYSHDLAVRLAAGAPVARPLLEDAEPPASLVDIVVDRYLAAV